MEQLCEVRTRLLLEMSADLCKQVAELRALRGAVRAAEATLAVPEPIAPAFVAPSTANELRTYLGGLRFARLRRPDVVRRLIEDL